MSFARRALTIVPDHLAAMGARLIPRMGHSTQEDDPLGRLEEGIEQLARLRHGRRPEVVLLLFTPLTDPEGSALAPALAIRLQELARRTGTLVVDTAGLVHSSELPDGFIIFPGDGHPNARANARVAERLAEALLGSDGFAGTLEAVRREAP